jgi:hypothetical protein
MPTQVKEKPIIFNSEMVRAVLDGRKSQYRLVIKPQPAECQSLARDCASPSGFSWISDAYEDFYLKCPYGVPGDRLWVRETWQKCTGCNPMPGILYRATCNFFPAHKWKPSIHMPRWASRILLEITDIRVERLQDISRQDAFKEGCIDRRPVSTCNDDFKELWNSINEAKGFGWDQNPWIWCICFKVIEL